LKRFFAVRERYGSGCGRGDSGPTGASAGGGAGVTQEGRRRRQGVVGPLAMPLRAAIGR